MKAVNGYYENGTFVSTIPIYIPKRVPAILLYGDDITNPDKNREERLVWLKKFNTALEQSADVEMPEFPRVKFGRSPIDFTEDE